jgi:hypothetical protein
MRADLVKEANDFQGKAVSLAKVNKSVSTTHVGCLKAQSMGALSSAANVSATMAEVSTAKPNKSRIANCFKEYL